MIFYRCPNFITGLPCFGVLPCSGDVASSGFPDYIGSLSKGLLGKFCHNPDTNRWYLNKALINIGMTLIRPYLVFGFAPGVLRTIFWQKHSKNKDLIRPY